MRLDLHVAEQSVVIERFPVREIARPLLDPDPDPVAVPRAGKRVRRRRVEDQRSAEEVVEFAVRIRRGEVPVEEDRPARTGGKVERETEPFQHLLREGVQVIVAVRRVIEQFLREIVGRGRGERDPAADRGDLFRQVGQRFVEPGVFCEDPAVFFAVREVAVQ